MTLWDFAIDVGPCLAIILATRYSQISEALSDRWQKFRKRRGESWDLLDERKRSEIDQTLLHARRLSDRHGIPLEQALVLLTPVTSP